MSIGMISSLPNSMSSERIILEKAEKAEKLPIGPTVSMPGPILFMHDSTAVKLVSRLKPSKDMKMQEEMMSVIYIAR